MSGDPTHSGQYISGVSTQNHSQAFVGNARDVYFTSSDDPQKIDEEAANACRNALFLTDPFVDRESLISTKGARVAGTCEWITRNESYRTWEDGGVGLLWISGGPGKGKTMLSVFLTEELERRISNIPNAQLVFYFCSHQQEKRNNAIAVLRGLLHQIVTKRPNLIKHALPYFETPERTQLTLSSVEALWIIFSRLIEDPELGTMLCVLDGIDECEESGLKALLPRIVSLLATRATPPTTVGFRLVIISRDLPGLQGCTRVMLGPDNNDKVSEDIERFVSARVDALSRIEGFNNDVRTAVQTTLLRRAEGTFLWIGFAMHELLQKKTCTQVLEALDELPSSLPAIYDRMILQIPTEHRQNSSLILRWVTMALRPLLIDELAAAIGVQPSSSLITQEQAICDAIALCGPLVKIQKRKIGLVHQSVRDYLLRKERDNNVVLEAFRIEPDNSHFVLARTCFDCISQSGLQRAAVKLDAKSRSQESPLLLYSVLHWPEHARLSSGLASELFNYAGPFFEKESSLREHWLVAYRKASGKILNPSLPLTLLHIVGYLGIVPWVEAVLEKERWRPRLHKRVDTKDNAGYTVLHWAVIGGRESVVRLLVGHGANVNAKTKEGETALYLAARWENVAVARLLVSSGVDVNAKINSGETVLHRAARWGSEALVRVLVDGGADVNAKDNDGETVLHRAARWRNEVVVRILVNSGADINAKSNDGETALHRAARWEKGVQWRMLVTSGAVKAKNKDGMMALYRAARWDEAVVWLLVDSGADVNATSNDGMTALQLAARWNEKVVRLLVDSGADVKATSNDGETALHWAVRWGSVAVVWLLLKSGADVNAKDNNGETALHRAARWRNEAVVRLLVYRGADVNVKSNDGETALRRAVKWKNEAVVQVLMDSRVGFNANINNGNDSAALGS